jgi:hypothetical protein
MLDFPTAHFSGVLFTWAQTDFSLSLLGLASNTTASLRQQIPRSTHFHRTETAFKNQLKCCFTTIYNIRENSPPN